MFYNNIDWLYRHIYNHASSLNFLDKLYNWFNHCNTHLWVASHVANLTNSSVDSVDLSVCWMNKCTATLTIRCIHADIQECCFIISFRSINLSFHGIALEFTFILYWFVLVIFLSWTQNDTWEAWYNSLLILKHIMLNNWEFWNLWHGPALEFQFHVGQDNSWQVQAICMCCFQVITKEVVMLVLAIVKDAFCIELEFCEKLLLWLSLDVD